MILHQFPMYIRYSFAWYGWYLPKIDRGTHIFRYEIELDPVEGEMGSQKEGTTPSSQGTTLFPKKSPDKTSTR